MINLSISGGNLKQRKHVERAVRFCLDMLIPSTRAIKLKIELKKMHDFGSVVATSDYNGFDMELNKKQSLGMLLKTVMHEMVHVKQSIKKEWTTYYSKCYWKGVDHTDTSYSQQPWERQAYRMQNKLYDGYKSLYKIKD